MTGGKTVALGRPVRGVRVRSSYTPTNCWPSFGVIELDFEPPPVEHTSAVCEFDCEIDPWPSREYEEALTEGVLGELAGERTDDYQARRGLRVRARVVVRELSYHPVDSAPVFFERMGAIAVREALRCVAEDREPDLGEATRVWPLDTPPEDA